MSFYPVEYFPNKDFKHPEDLELESWRIDFRGSGYLNELIFVSVA